MATAGYRRRSGSKQATEEVIGFLMAINVVSCHSVPVEGHGLQAWEKSIDYTDQHRWPVCWCLHPSTKTHSLPYWPHHILDAVSAVDFVCNQNISHTLQCTSLWKPHILQPSVVSARDTDRRHIFLSASGAINTYISNNNSRDPTRDMRTTETCVTVVCYHGNSGAGLTWLRQPTVPPFTFTLSLLRGWHAPNRHLQVIWPERL